MTSVAGTAVFDARDDDRARALIVSDLHVDREGGDVITGFESVCRIAAEDRPVDTRLIVLGDLFEVFVSMGQIGLGAWRRVADAIRGASAAGVSVTVIHGNRDFLLDDRFGAATGCRVLPGGVRFRLPDGRVALGIHGDELCLNDTAYQRSKPWLRSRGVRWLARVLPTAAALRLGGAARARSRAGSDDQGHTVDPAVEQPDVEPLRYAPVREAVSEVFTHSDLGAEFLVFGHIHRMARGAFRPDGAAAGPDPGHPEYCVLPAFDADGVFLEADADGVRYRTVAEGRVADPAPRAFPALETV